VDEAESLATNIGEALPGSDDVTDSRNGDSEEIESVAAKEGEEGPADIGDSSKESQEAETGSARKGSWRLAINMSP
jgi:hypothetical protein